MKEYTVKEIADIIEVSKPTVQRAINSAAVEADTVDKQQRRFYSEDKAREIIISIKPNFDFSTCDIPPQSATDTDTNRNTEKQADTKADTESNTAPQSETDRNTAPQNENSSTIDKALDILEKQLEDKDKTIKDLQDKLAAAYDKIADQSNTIADLAQKAQYITAADKTALIMDKQQKAAEEAEIVEDTVEAKEENKKGFFSRLFKRKSDK